MREETKDFLIAIGIIVFALCVVYFAGYKIGSNRVRHEIIYKHKKPDREYIQRYNVAGEGEYVYILTREYVMDAEFVVDGYQADWEEFIQK